MDNGHGVISGNILTGSITISSVSQFGFFTLGTTAPAATCSSPTPNYTWTDESVMGLGISSLPMTPGQTLKISGTLTIDADFSLSGGIVFMDDDARIVVNPSCTLSISNALIKPCNNYQWDYIKIEGPTAHLIVGTTTLIGADSAIWSSNGGVFTIGKAVNINRCYKGIMVDDYGSAHTGSIKTAWIGCATVPGGTTPTNLYNPHSSIRSSIGMHVVNATSLTIGTTPSVIDDVEFFNIKNGILGINTSLTIRNCNFNKIDNSGTAIQLSSTTGGVFTLTVGNGMANSCNFYDCRFGVVSENTHATISHNNFNYDEYGIRMSTSSIRKQILIDCILMEIGTPLILIFIIIIKIQTLPSLFMLINSSMNNNLMLH